MFSLDELRHPSSVLEPESLGMSMVLWSTLMDFGAWGHCVQAVFYVHRGWAGARVKESTPGVCIHGNMSVSRVCRGRLDPRQWGSAWYRCKLRAWGCRRLVLQAPAWVTGVGLEPGITRANKGAVSDLEPWTWDQVGIRVYCGGTIAEIHSGVRCSPHSHPSQMRAFLSVLHCLICMLDFHQHWLCN